MQISLYSIFAACPLCIMMKACVMDETENTEVASHPFSISSYRTNDLVHLDLHYALFLPLPPLFFTPL